MKHEFKDARAAADSKRAAIDCAVRPALRADKRNAIKAARSAARVEAEAEPDRAIRDGERLRNPGAGVFVVPRLHFY